MTRRPPLATWLAALPLLWACGAEPEVGPRTDRSGMPPFCREALARVDSFMATVPDVPEDERHGGTAVVAGPAEIPDGMMGLVSADYSATQHQAFVNLTTLVRYDSELELAPWLAESWKLSEDGTTLTFRLRDDVRWHDGQPTDAHDVAFTYRRAADPATGFPNAQYFRFYDRGDGGVEVVDSLTVRFRMRPHAGPLDGWTSTPILPEHLLGGVPPEELRRHPYGTVCPVGNGPFVFVEHRQDASWTFRANPAFPQGLGGRPYLDRYVYRVIAEQTTSLTELLTGNLDVLFAARPDQAERIREAEDVEIRVFPFRQFNFVAWNTRIDKLSDPRVRRALTVGTNRREIVDAILHGYGIVANTTVPPFHWAYDPTLGESLSYDPDRARALLDEAGWRDRDGDGVREDGDGAPLRVTVIYQSGNRQRQDIAEIMQAQLREVGVAVVPRSLEYATMVSRLTDTENRDFEGAVLAFVADFRLDDSQLFHSDAADEPLGFSGLRRPDVDRLLDTLPLIRDRRDALRYWREYQEKVVELQPFTFFYFQERIDGVAGRLRGVEMDVRGDWINVHEWWIPRERRTYAGGRPGG